VDGGKRITVNADNSSITNTLALCGQSKTKMPDIRGSRFHNPTRPGNDPTYGRTYSTEDMLLKEVQPRLKIGIERSIPQIGADDPGELLQDGMVIALHIINSAERAGKKVSAGNVSYYTLKALRMGRRSTGFRKTDPLHPAAQLSGRCHIHSLDDRLAAPQSSDDPLTIAEVLASKQDDPSTKAARQLDWDELIQDLNDVAREILTALANGLELTLLVPRLGRSRSALQSDKRDLAKCVREHLGDDILRQVQERPAWQNNIAAMRERLACYRERLCA
jgi:hypothetical protein